MTPARPAVAVGELRAVALPGDAAPSPLRGHYRRIVASSLDDAGRVALSVELSDGSTALLVLDQAGEAEVVASGGDPAPGGGRYAAFPELDLADGGWLLFTATLDGGAAGLFLRGRDGTVQRVAGSARYAAFTRPTVVPAGAAAASFAFIGRLPDGTVELEQHPGYEQPRVTLRTGSALADGSIVHELSISPFGMGLCVVAQVSRGGADLAKAVVVTPAVVSSGDWTETGGELPGHGRIEHLLTPPALCAQLGFVTVRLADGRHAVCSRPPVLVDPTVVLVSGTDAPGIDGSRIATIGPPVASSSAALQTPFGLVCPVTLDDGRPAVWTGVFGGQVPLDGAAILPWLDGERAANRPDRPVDRLLPVKLGNDGTLLATAAGGVYTLPDLFTWYG